MPGTRKCWSKSTFTKNNIKSFIEFSMNKIVFDTVDFVGNKELCLYSIRGLIDGAQELGYIIRPVPRESGAGKRCGEYVYKYYGKIGEEKYGMFVIDEVAKSSDLIHVLVDVNNLLFRMFFATKGSIPTTLSHFKGVLNKVKDTLKMREESKKYKIIFMHDAKSDFRKKLYPDYKAGRHEGVDIDWDALNKARDMIKSWKKYKQYMINGFECDDLIGAYVDRLVTLREEGLRKNKRDLIIIVSNDKDFYQLVNSIKGCEVVIARPGKVWSFVTKDFISKEYNITPRLVLDMKAMMGDGSDNIKGIEGIGEKRALRLLTNLGGLDRWCFPKVENMTDKDRKEISSIVRDVKLEKEFKKCRSKEGKKILKRNIFLMDLMNDKILDKIDFGKNLIKRKENK